MPATASSDTEPPPPARPTSGCGRIWSGCGSSCAASRRRRES